MTLANCSLAAFALLNFARVIAYIPQIIRIHRDTQGAASVSIMTWVLFTGANVTTVTYAIAGGESADYLIAFVFSLNAIGCGSIASLTAWKRVAFAKQAEKSRPDLGLPTPSASPIYSFDGGGLLRRAA